MRNFTTILLLAGFLVGQCAKQLVYWKCRLATIVTSSSGCDCEKLNPSSANTGEVPASTHTTTHRHVVPEDSCIIFPVTVQGITVERCKIPKAANDLKTIDREDWFDHPPEAC